MAPPSISVRPAGNCASGYYAGKTTIIVAQDLYKSWSLVILVTICRVQEDGEWSAVEEEMQSTVREHRDQGHAGGIFSSYNIIKIQKIRCVILIIV